MDTSLRQRPVEGEDTDPVWTYTRQHHVYRFISVMAMGEGLPPGLGEAFSFADARRLGMSQWAVERLLATGEIQKVARGVYRRSDAPDADWDRLEVGLRAPEATLCLISALVEHDLADDNPSRLDLALPRGKWHPKLESPIRWHSFAAGTFEVDRKLVGVAEGVSVHVYGPKRSIIDAFRLSHDIGHEVAVTALRVWLRRPGSQAGELLAMSNQFPKAKPSLLAALQVLL